MSTRNIFGILMLAGLMILALVLMEEGRESGSDSNVVLLNVDEPNVHVLDLEKQSFRSFAINVPNEAILLSLSMEVVSVDLDLKVRHVGSNSSYSAQEHFTDAQSGKIHRVMRLARVGSSNLESGTYNVTVSHPKETVPQVNGESLSLIPFTLAARLVPHEVDRGIVEGEAITSEISAESGWYKEFSISVPEGTNSLRIDLDANQSDLDLALRYQAPITSIALADHTSETDLARESLLIDRNSEPPLIPGIWHVGVYDQNNEHKTPFSVYATFSRSPPDELKKFPRLQLPEDQFKRAIAASVQINTSDWMGSGILVSPSGYILTNHHIVEMLDGRIIDDEGVIIGLTLDPQLPTMELFRGSVIRFDKSRDLALIKVVSGLYGQPLPDGFGFPYLPLVQRSPVEMGDKIHLLGYPEVGGQGSRVSISLTQGIVSGFDHATSGPLIKADVEIAEGSSGGAVLDEQWGLIGVARSTREENEGLSKLGYIIPITRIPEDWTKLLAEQGNSLVP